MYARCSRFSEAQDVWNETPVKAKNNVYSWTNMINIYMMSGMAAKALDLFDQMVQQNVQPNRITFIVLLNACR